MIFANYECCEQIGQGAFGTIYSGKNRRTGEKVVIKMEPKSIAFSSLKHESNLLNILYSKHCRNIPPTYWYGVVSDWNKRVLVMPFYEQSLQDVLSSNRPLNRSSSSFLQIASNIMRSAISILQHVHEKYVIHRDIKPANFMVHNDELLLIDFGLASFYVDSDENHIHPANPKKTHIIGTPKYASWNIHEGEEYSRRDDLMSIIYIGLFLLHGNYLWGINHRDSECTFTEFSSELKNSDLLHPMNQWFKRQKNKENVKLMSSEWNKLQIFAENIYNLSFQERPSYKKYIELF